MGQKHDDAIYLIASRSLALDGTYRITSLPAEPFETKYPPVLPLLLTVAWFSGRPYPQNLPIATIIEWMAIPALLWLALIYYRKIGLSKVERWSAAALLAISPYTVVMGAGIFTEVWFAVFLVASLLACERARSGDRSLRWAFAAGLLAGVAYLTRSAGVVALVSGPAAFLLWKRRLEALAYAAGMAPCAAGWAVWTQTHRTTAHDVVSIYNTDYLGFLFLGVKWRDLGAIAWTNASHFLDGIAALPFPLKTDLTLWQLLLWAVAVAIIASLFRCRHNRALWPYLLYCGLCFPVHLVWNYPPDLRFLYPLAPLFAAGLILEAKRISCMCSASAQSVRTSDRAAAWGAGLFASALVLAGVSMNLYMVFATMRTDIARNRQELDERLQVYRWVERNVAPGDGVLANNPVLFLYTRRKTAPVLRLPIYWYRQDMARLNAPLRELGGHAAGQGLTWVCMRLPEFEEPGANWERATRGTGLLEAFRQGDTAVFRVARETKPIW